MSANEPSGLHLNWTDPGTGQPRSEPLRAALRIGSNPEWNDIVLASAGINPLHVDIQAAPGGELEVVAMGSSVVLLNGRQIKRERLAEGSTLGVGSISFRIGRPVLKRPTPPPPPPRPVPSTPRPSVSTTTTTNIHALPKPPSPGFDMKQIAVLAGAVAFGVLLAGAGFYFWQRARVPKSAPAAPAPATKSTPAPETGIAAFPTTPAGSFPTAALLPTTVPSTAPAAGDPFVQAKSAVVTVIAKHSFDPGFSTGSGFFVSSQGRVVTNLHVIAKTDYQQILLPGNKKPIDARILARDDVHDLALLQAYVTPPVPIAPLGASAALRSGHTVFALGSPSGPMLEATMSKGIISTDQPRIFGQVQLLQHDAAINPGNSGGPLLNQDGLVVGVNTLKIRNTEGINFAIPVEDVRRFLDGNL